MGEDMFCPHLFYGGLCMELVLYHPEMFVKNYQVKPSGPWGCFVG